MRTWVERQQYVLFTRPWRYRCHVLYNRSPDGKDAPLCCDCSGSYRVAEKGTFFSVCGQPECKNRVLAHA